ncbi:hypothetical protein OPU71_12270 [Niveibacterium sp. 24ML]|uniref:hypothetical protein n=1 Tax=Niveibacterium sp. 24ML TaxID=2985512 RepID=UPI002271AD14|nr:hypothetical protein [Niveibacterium sp. 24ML]MCX9156901.1 hypothetical protein [Niveibacterium sp. 24ML]
MSRAAAGACGISQAQGIRRLTQTYAMTIGLWQMLDWPPALAALLQQPEFSLLRADFETELRDALERLWA